MNRLILSLRKKFLIPVVVIAALSLWLALCKIHYDSYWDGTIFRVQTIDFNLLHHTLPVTLSQLIIAGRDDSIQRVLDCTYGIFGLVITDPGGTSVLYKTSKVYHKDTWQQAASPESLANSAEPFDILTEPPPGEPMFEHTTPRAVAATQVGKVGAGRVLGRVYYVRAPEPTFLEDLKGFLGSNWFVDSGAHRGYLLQTLVTMGFSLALVFLVLFRQRTIEIKQKEIEHKQKEMAIRKKALDHLTAELSAQNARKDWLEKEADQTYRRAIVLKSALEQLRESIADSARVDKAEPSPAKAGIKVRPAPNPPSALLQEVEGLVSTLTSDAQQLKGQAEQLQGYCQQLEHNHAEMKRIVEGAITNADPDAGNLVKFPGKN